VLFRGGAHNWEGQGFGCVLAAIDALVAAAGVYAAGQYSADGDRLLVAGHSRGGHGAWQVATKLPDRVMALVVCAGWTERQYYGK
jgi:predicted peptidase